MTHHSHGQIKVKTNIAPKVEVRFATPVCQPLKGSQPITCRSKNSAVSLHMKCTGYDLSKHFSASTAPLTKVIAGRYIERYLEKCIRRRLHFLVDFACTRLFCLAKEAWENQVSYTMCVPL